MLLIGFSFLNQGGQQVGASEEYRTVPMREGSKESREGQRPSRVRGGQPTNTSRGPRARVWGARPLSSLNRFAGPQCGYQTDLVRFPSRNSQQFRHFWQCCSSDWLVCGLGEIERLKLFQL